MNVIAIDVGTTSVRVAIISFRGNKTDEVYVLASQEKVIKHTKDGFKFEQNTAEIWEAICECCQGCLQHSSIEVDSIKSIGFSATCSLVVVQGENNLGAQNDVIMWMDHRAIAEAKKITDSGSKVLDQFGGVCSPEFSLSKLVWLKNNQPNIFQTAKGFFELPDWLVHRCIGDQEGPYVRSLCCLVCKWGYQVEAQCHCDIIKSLDEKTGANKFGNITLGPGSVAGRMSQQAAQELGLLGKEINKENAKPIDVVVGTSLIDAHSGLLAMLSVPFIGHNLDQKIETTFCSLAGTSSCHMLLSQERKFTPGIWGPYKDVVLEGYHLLEAGQSLTGKLIEICIESHADGKARLVAGEKMYDIIKSLNSQVESIQQENKIDLHILPTYHGNRSPLANPRLRGGIYGLSSDRQKSLLEYYIATIESLCYELKLIMETLKTHPDTILVSGGLMKNTIYMQILADVLGCRVLKLSLETIDFMVMGSALVARQAAINHKIQSKIIYGGQPLTLTSIANLKYEQLSVGTYRPRESRAIYHEKKYLCYKELVECSQRIDKILNQ